MNRGVFRDSADWVINRYHLTGPKVVTVIGTVILLLLTLFFVNVAANIASFWAPVKAYSHPLQDLVCEFFNVTAYTTAYNNTVDSLLIPFCAVTAVVIVLNPLAIFIALKLMIAIIISYLLRVSTLLVTSLPDSWNMGTRTVEDTYAHFGRDRGGDLIFSGHTMLIVLFAHAWSSFYLITDSYALHWITGLLAWAYTIMVLIFITVARLHYTIDVLLALYIASGVWWSLSYFQTRFFEEPVSKMKFRRTPVPPLNSRSADEVEQQPDLSVQPAQ
ncbi:hypothetical protein NEHOM01_1061 [Nematocida homosporus]|uniref:uncharacterized protein n=1 Tax=Nematocida homosporus TaxID=1912981 RepID=UPI00221FD721|nr:uncharacterized protein NEHOM01_1061 [Nematocida homosporus]KAI5185784.1 hypothetical protein NEHOM01_1061 [Nematocida homosporus]